MVHDGMAEPLNLDWDTAMGDIQAQEYQFWEVESKARMINATMTPYEASKVSDLPAIMPVLGVSDASKITRFFGKPVGAQKAAKRLLKTMCANFRKGQECKLFSPEWTVCKHLLLAHNSSDNDDVMQGIPEGQSKIGCNCFSKTFVMPKGCPCHGGPLWSTYLPQTMCSTCSKCQRCDKLCRVAVARDLGYQGVSSMMDQGTLCMCHSSGLFPSSAWRHYHIIVPGLQSCQQPTWRVVAAGQALLHAKWSQLRHRPDYGGKTPSHSLGNWVAENGWPQKHTQQ